MWLPWQDSDRVVQQPECYYASLELWDFIQLLAEWKSGGKLLDTHPIHQAKLSLASSILLNKS